MHATLAHPVALSQLVANNLAQGHVNASDAARATAVGAAALDRFLIDALLVFTEVSGGCVKHPERMNGWWN